MKLIVEKIMSYYSTQEEVIKAYVERAIDVKMIHGKDSSGRDCIIIVILME